jgi:coatomer subunit gamma
LKFLSNKELTGVISVLSIFLLSLSNINKFITLRILNKLVSNPVRRNLITNTGEIENLLTD